MSDYENKLILLGDVGQKKPRARRVAEQDVSGADIAADLLAKVDRTADSNTASQSSVPAVTMIEAQKRAGRYNVYLDGKYAFPISESVMIKFQIFKGMEIDQKLQEQIIAADDVARAYNRALDYLSGQLRSEREVEEKLASLEIEPGVITDTLQRLRDLRLVDDQAYANAYVRTIRNTSDKGPIVIRQNLRRKGIGENLIDRALEEFAGDEQVENGVTVANKLAKHYARKPFSTQKQKVIQGLMTKGFTREVIDQVMSQLELERDDEAEQDLLLHEATKIWARNRRYDRRDRVNRTKRTLFGKGYQMDEISRVVEQLQMEDD
ncbi:regulatory protein RecX [Furfurilactobacillus siliginis]|nr:regulatory protein RecX [Furfurilactobacillus siliginis]